jgi:hypothetical protein
MGRASVGGSESDGGGAGSGGSGGSVRQGALDAALERIVQLLRGKRRPAVAAKHTGAPNDEELQHSLTQLAGAAPDCEECVSDASLASLLACLRSTDAGAVQAVLKAISYLAGGWGRRVGVCVAPVCFGGVLGVRRRRAARRPRLWALHGRPHGGRPLAPYAGVPASSAMRAASHRERPVTRTHPVSWALPPKSAPRGARRSCWRRRAWWAASSLSSAARTSSHAAGRPRL